MRGGARLLLAGGCLAGSVIGGAGVLEAQRAVQAPEARYQMDVGTTSGFGGMGGGNPMAALFGGRGGAMQHTLSLRLGSRLAPNGGEPHADHLMPPGAGLGASVPLETPVTTTAPETPDQPEIPEHFRRPKGRMLIFWGCGAHAGPGQPVIVDFAKLAAGQAPPHLSSVSVPVETGPTQANSRTFGDWPNSRSHKNVGADASLIGEHRVKGNYSPDIAFSLDQDFMAPLRLSSSTAADGSTPLSWTAVPAATGYYAFLFGAQGTGSDSGDVVMWSSAQRQEMGGGLSDWLAPATVARLIGQHIVMPPSQTECTVPAEVKQAAGQVMMLQLYAYGPEKSFAYPPRPADPKTPWKPEWTARVRYRSTTGTMLGMPGMAAMQGDSADDARDDQPPETHKRKCKSKGLGGFLKGKLGVGC
jgi:hypothetical protein